MQPGIPPGNFDPEALRKQAEQMRQQVLPDLQAAVAQAQQLQQKLLEAQQQIAETKATGQAGGGLVEADTFADIFHCAWTAAEHFQKPAGPSPARR